MIKGIRRTSFTNAKGIKMYSYYINRDAGSPKFWGPTDLKIDLASQKGLPSGFPEAYTDKKREWEQIIRDIKPDMERFIDEYLEDDRFKGSDQIEGLAKETQANYRMHAEKIRKKFGTISIDVIEDRRFKGAIIKWHLAQGSASAKSADDALTVLSNILDRAFRQGALLRNPAEGIDQLYERPDDKRPVTAEEHKRFMETASQERQDIAETARFTGLRRTDLSTLSWTENKGNRIEKYTSKSRFKKLAIIPLTEEAQAHFARLKARQMNSPLGLQPTVLLGSRGKKMLAGTVGAKVNKWFDKLQIDKTLHNYRNSYVTVLVQAGFSNAEIASIMGWASEDVEELIRVYVRPEEIAAANVAKLERKK